MGAEVESEKEGEEVSQDIDTEEEDNEGLFSTPKRGGTPRPTSRRAFSSRTISASICCPAKTCPLRQYLFTLQSHKKLHYLPINSSSTLKRPADPLGGLPIYPENGKSTIKEKVRWSRKISDILKVVRELSQTVKKQTLKIKEKIKKISGGG